MLCSIAESISQEDIRLIHALSNVFKLYCTKHEFVAVPDTQLSNVLSYIIDHIGEKLTVEKLSRLAGYNVQYFIRLFSHDTGLTPHQYIIDSTHARGYPLLTV